MSNSKLTNPETGRENKQQISNEILLGLWLDNNLNQEQRLVFEQRCIHDEAFSQQVEMANILNVQVESYQDDVVPNWDREASFTQPEKAKWWQWQGLPSLSLGASALAIVMVLTGVQVKLDDGSMTISFAEQHSAQEIDRIVAAKLNEFSQNQQLALNEYSSTMQEQQLTTSAKLTEYLLKASRQERREDFAELIKYVNEQRSDDQNFYARQLNKLQNDIYDTPVETGVNSINK
ncbi:hypothetical protein [Paraglaciecola sp.]|uniref:hypothetical protein n=1 Tax=Paraglaciecola sp. TaxID=1920173 RepID=UPI003EF1202B